MFNEINKIINDIFTIDDLYLNKNYRIVNHFDITKGVRDMSGKALLKQINTLNTVFNFVILKDQNGYIATDITVYDNNICFYIVVPYDIAFDDFDAQERKNIVYNIYKYIVEYFKNRISAPEGSSIDRILNIAPEILSIHTLYAFPYPLKELTSIEKGITEEIVDKCTKETIEDLLDNELVISIMEGR